MSQPYIEVRHSTDLLDIASCYSVDVGPLAMPDHIRIGTKGTDCGGGHDYTINRYGDQVDEYAVWLEDAIKTENPLVLKALDDIYNMALGAGVILHTRQTPCPNMTHAHEVKRAIMKLT
jgi:hypothetical protein